MNLVVSAAAQADIEEITTRSEQEWGSAATTKYLDQLKSDFVRLPRHPELGRPRDDVASGYRSIQSGRHIIFYRLQPGSIEIDRILHDRMNPPRHLPSE